MNFKTKSKADRIELLSANASRREQFTYFKQMGEDELKQFEQRYFALHAEIDTHEEQLLLAKEEFKQAVAPLKSEMTECYAVVKSKGEQITEEVYLIANHEAGIMEYMNSEGELVFSRRLLPNENQTMMKVVNE
jgi:hypothetical protein